MAKRNANPKKSLHVLHVIYQLNTGGLENGVINLINQLPSHFQHTILSLTYATDFAKRIDGSKRVKIVCLHKSPGSMFKWYPQLLKLIRQSAPDIVHTRNLATLECQFLAWLAKVPLRIHGEHGRDVGDLSGDNKKNQRLRKLFKPFVHRFVPLSKELENYLKIKIGISHGKIHQIYNGVDITRFSLATHGVGKWPFSKNDLVLIAVGRMQPVKDFATLIQAFGALKKRLPNAQSIKLALVGDGPCLEELKMLAQHHHVHNDIWFPGHREDVHQLLSQAHIFIQCSLIEGISNTLLEACASGLPCVVTKVGGNCEIIESEQMGMWIDTQNVSQLTDCLAQYCQSKALRKEHGSNARLAIEQKFNLLTMVQHYQRLYEAS